MSLKKAHAAGASKSLNKTISEIMNFLGDDAERPAKELRKFLHDKMGDLAEHWYHKGFNRGHRESYEAFKAKGEVPAHLKAEKKRTLSHNQERSVLLKSRIKKRAR